MILILKWKKKNQQQNKTIVDAQMKTNVKRKQNATTTMATIERRREMTKTVDDEMA